MSTDLFPKKNTSLLNDEVLEETFRYGFRIAELGFLIPLNTHSTLIENAAIFPIPNTITWLTGLVNVRGKMVPVFDLGRMLGTDIKPTKNSVMVMMLAKSFIAFNVDSGHSLKESVLLQSAELASEHFQKYTKKNYLYQSEHWIEFDFLKCMEHYKNQVSI